MPEFPHSPGSLTSASLIVVDPNGSRTRIELQPLPFKIGRLPDNHLIVRDNRVSRTHAQIVLENGEYFIEDCRSSRGTFVNSSRIERHKLQASDRIEFGFPDSHQLVFSPNGAELSHLMEQFPSHDKPVGKAGTLGSGGNLAKLRAVLEVARTLQSSFSMQDVLCSVVDAALAITGAERGFLLLRRDEDLEIRVARDRRGVPLAENDLRVPRRVIQRALKQRCELLSMNFDSSGNDAVKPEHSVADLELRSVVGIPLVRISARAGDDTSMLSPANDTVGVLYMDSRIGAADLSAGNRELLQTLALEASTILENARLLEQERVQRKIEQELMLARSIQQSLLPRELPSKGWFRAAGSSVASLQVGGDYFDVLKVNESLWATAVADVSGKGVGSALLASFLQGAFLTVSESTFSMQEMMHRINGFLSERSEGSKYATIFYSLLDETGLLRYINAGHCAPIVVPIEGKLQYLDTTAMPVGLIGTATYAIQEKQFAAGDKIVIYSDGVTEAQSPENEFFGRKRLREAIRANARSSCLALHDAIQETVVRFAQGAPQADDVTLVVLEYRP